jgi:HK97 family phage prohead protease
MAYLSTKAFKAAIKAQKPVQASAELPTLRKAFFAKAEDGETARTIKFTISTNAVDLDNDTVNQDGWDLSVFLANPLVLWMHDNTQLPIGKCISIAVEGGALKATVEFLPLDTPERGPFAEAVYQMCRTGFLSATSVGFLPLAYEIAADRSDENSWWPAVNFTKQKLLEWSIVTVPANSEALIDPGERAAPPPTPPAAPSQVVTTDDDDATAQATAAALTAKAELNAVFERHKLMSRIL